MLCVRVYTAVLYVVYIRFHYKILMSLIKKLKNFLIKIEKSNEKKIYNTYKYEKKKTVENLSFLPSSPFHFYFLILQQTHIANRMPILYNIF